MKKILRNIVLKFDLLFQFYYRFLWRPKRNSIPCIINNLSKSKKIYFIQIGANDGMYNDPLYKFIRRDNWEGILIEPQRNIFMRLKHNYKKMNNLIFENVAVCNKNGLKSLYKISFSDANWASSISSFRKEDVEALINSGYVEKKAIKEGIKLPTNRKEYITTEKVNCVTLENLILKYDITNIDMLMIDAEGYDFEIIKTINFNKVKPLNIVYEHTHLSKKEKIECKNYLKSAGYNLFEDISDTLAYL
ncbi:MAG: FkbM family methyltransferase [Candidatus Marinimicrobia bacterium]|jgi:FkbM family methyltransferase|nr:FkbM family methyltransferase [Candidatus Neomarinimicrobiota bacterium]